MRWSTFKIIINQHITTGQQWCPLLLSFKNKLMIKKQYGSVQVSLNNYQTSYVTFITGHLDAHKRFQRLLLLNKLL